MTKSFVLLFLAVGLISGSSDENESDEEDEENEVNAAMSCILFGNEGCHVGCAITSPIFKYKAYGNCDSNQTCHCYNYGNQSFHKMWKKAFGEEYVYRKIVDNDLSHQQALRIFSDPFQTAEGFKKRVSSLISPYQLSRLEASDNHYTAKYVKDGRFDMEDLRKYVLEKLETHLKSKKGKTLLNSKFIEKFRKALENSEGTKGSVYNFTYKVGQLQNKTLENILEAYLKKENIQKPEIKIPIKNEDVNIIVDHIVLNELIKRIEEKGKNSTTSAAATKKPAKNRTARNRPAKKSP